MHEQDVQRVFVTGADGFIGSHLVEHLLARGHVVTALCQYNSFGRHGWLETSTENTHPNLTLVLGDVRDAVHMRHLCDGMDVILNLAALIAIPYSYSAAQSYIDTNISGTLNLLEAARHHGVRRFIQTSTSEVYGSAQFTPITEEHPLNAQSPYAATKIASDQLALSYHRSHGLEVSVIRPFNTFGPRQSMRAVIPTIIRQALAGDQIQIGDLEPKRDMNFVGDIVRGFEAAITADKAVGEVINLGTNFEVSVGDMIKIVGELLGRTLEPCQQGERLRPVKSEVTRLLASNEKARDILGWTPEAAGYEGFVAGMRKTVDWFASPQNQALYTLRGFVY